MIIYTVQTEEAWKQFKKLGYLEGNKELSTLSLYIHTTDGS